VRAGVPVALLLAWACAPAQADTIGGLPPVITGLSATQVPGQKFTISGRVADNNPGSCTVTISGVASGTTTCDAQGDFSVTLAVPTLGNISVVASDGTLNSTAAGLNLINGAPGITMQAVRNGAQVTFSGSVADEAPAGLTVTLSGTRAVNGRTATVAADGSWSITVTILAGNGGSGGNVTATVTDWYGQTGQAYTSYY
jgi:hypothetical protein